MFKEIRNGVPGYRDIANPAVELLRAKIDRLRAEGYTCIALPEPLPLPYKIQELENQVRSTRETKTKLEPEKIALYSEEVGVLLPDDNTISQMNYRSGKKQSIFNNYDRDTMLGEWSRKNCSVLVDGEYRAFSILILADNGTIIRNESHR